MWWRMEEAQKWLSDHRLSRWTDLSRKYREFHGLETGSGRKRGGDLVKEHRSVGWCSHLVEGTTKLGKFRKPRPRRLRCRQSEAAVTGMSRLRNTSICKCQTFRDFEPATVSVRRITRVSSLSASMLRRRSPGLIVSGRFRHKRNVSAMGDPLSLKRASTRTRRSAAPYAVRGGQNSSGYRCFPEGRQGFPTTWLVGSLISEPRTPVPCSASTDSAAKPKACVVSPRSPLLGSFGAF
jgi:hypothetical protein